jgi:hypothetical protein
MSAPRLTVFYEDLVNTTIQSSVLVRMVRFLLGDDAKVTQERLQCAFNQADSPEIHRSGTDKVTALEVYDDSVMVCQIWKIIQSWARPHGYRPINDVECD